MTRRALGRLQPEPFKYHSGHRSPVLPRRGHVATVLLMRLHFATGRCSRA